VCVQIPEAAHGKLEIQLRQNQNRPNETPQTTNSRWEASQKHQEKTFALREKSDTEKGTAGRSRQQKRNVNKPWGN